MVFLQWVLDLIHFFNSTFLYLRRISGSSDQRAVTSMTWKSNSSNEFSIQKLEASFCQTPIGISNSRLLLSYNSSQVLELEASFYPTPIGNSNSRLLVSCNSSQVLELEASFYSTPIGNSNSWLGSCYYIARVRFCNSS